MLHFRIAIVARLIAPMAAATAGRSMRRNWSGRLRPRKGEVAAFIVEPVSGATLGAVVPPPGYLQSVAEICRRHGVLLIADEVMTGMGRTGRNFAVEHWDVAPDILVAAKGLSSGYAPLGAVLVSKRVADAIADGSGAFLHGFTYNSHPISLAAGRAVLRVSARAKSWCRRRIQIGKDRAAATLRHALEGLRDAKARWRCARNWIAVGCGVRR